MRTFESDISNDLVLIGGGLNPNVTALEAVAQVAKHYMLTRRDEMIHDMQNGIPYDIIVWGASPSIQQFEAAGRTRLMQVPDVVEVVQFTARQVGDILDYVAVLRTIYGETTVNGQL